MYGHLLSNFFLNDRGVTRDIHVLCCRCKLVPLNKEIWSLFARISAVTVYLMQKFFKLPKYCVMAVPDW